MAAWLLSTFPNLQRCIFRKTSEETVEYNCIGYAAGETDRWWWPVGPDNYWPSGISRAESIESFVDAFRTLGYEPCENYELEEGFEKVAIYANAFGIPTHMARQLPSGSWTSKLGREIDIEHGTVAGLEGASYGTVSLALKRASGEGFENI